MGDEETPDPGNLTHLASDREQEDRRGRVTLVTLVNYTQLMVTWTWRILSFFLVTVLALLWFIPSCSACRSVHLKLYAKIVVILLLFATWGRIALALWCDEKVRGYSLKYVQPSSLCVDPSPLITNIQWMRNGGGEEEERAVELFYSEKERLESVALCWCPPWIIDAGSNPDRYPIPHHTPATAQCQDKTFLNNDDAHLGDKAGRILSSSKYDYL